MEKTVEKERIFLILILVLASVLRFFHLDHFSFWFDEAISWHIAQLSYSGIIELAKIDNTPPTYHFILRTWQKIVSLDTDFAVKIPTVIFGIFGIFMTYKLGKLLFNSKIGLYSAFFGATSYLWIHYSQENRGYSLQILLTIISLYYFIKGLRNNRIHHWIIWTVSGILLFYNHLFGVFVFITEWIYFIVRWNLCRKRIKEWIIANMFLGAALALWIPVILRQISVVQSAYWIPPVSFNEVIVTFIRFMGGTFFLDKFLLTALLHIPFIVLIISAFIAFFKFENKEKLIIPILLFIPVILVYIYSLGKNSLFYYRYLIIITPAIPIILALGINYFNKKIAKYIVLSSFLMVTTVFLHGYYSNSEYSEEQRAHVREVVGLLDQRGINGEVIFHQGAVNLGMETYIVSTRYNKGKYREFIWRKRDIPLYFGSQYIPFENRINDLSGFVDEKRIWVISIKRSQSYNEEGLPVFEPGRLSSADYSDIPKDLWEEFKKYSFKLSGVNRFEKLILCEFVKSEDE